MPPLKKKNDPLTDHEIEKLNQKQEKEYETYNQQQRVHIKSLSEIFKQIIEDEESSVALKGKCDKGLQILRDFVQYNKTNSCKTKKEMSERLRDLYDKVKEFHKELSLFEDSQLEQVESELEQIDDIMTAWYLIIVTVQNVRPWQEPNHEETQRKWREWDEDMKDHGPGRRYKGSTLHVLLQRLKQAQEDEY